uniref:Deoxynucleotidyltransferase, terminal n=1 Tax=Sphaeramia orbicularis TaxID=375764 RepID=A0A673CB12_9TELE
MFRSILPRARKRSKPAEAGVPRHEEVKFEDIRLYLVERKMGSSRRGFLTQLARSKGFIVEDILSNDVTHVVSEDNQPSPLWTWLRGRGLKDLPRMHVVDISWFTESMRASRPVAVETRHRIQVCYVSQMRKEEDTFPTAATHVVTVSQYACQRRTTTENKNKIFTDAFEVLVDNYDFNEVTGPSLAFSRAASVLKSLPWTVQSLDTTHNLPCLGEHTKAVMEEILRYGRSFEVEKILADERYQTLKLFTSVFGVGPKTAEKWYRRGLRSFSHVLTDPSIHLNRMQRSGFLHYGDISRAVSKAEARALGNIIDEAAHAITPDAVLALTGGFRRGKEFGHDVDFIVTTPELGKEESLLPIIIDRLKQQGILLFSDYHPSTFDATRPPSRSFEAMDHFAKCFLILRLDGGQVEGGLTALWRIAEAGGRCEWTWSHRHGSFRLYPRAGRAPGYDGLHGPKDGDRQFERDLRRLARLERRMLLDTTPCSTKPRYRFLAAVTEKDIFAHLGLEYIEPWQRNA